MLNKTIQKLCRKLILLLIFVLSILLFFSFILKPKSVTINMVVQAVEATSWREIIEDFEEAYPNIHIHLVEASDATDDVEKLYSDNLFCKANKTCDQLPTYDLVYMDIVWVPKFAQNNWLVSLNKSVDNDLEDLEDLEDFKKDFLSNDWRGGIYLDKLYRIPFHSDVGMLYYRKDLLEKVEHLEPPKTFDDLINLSEKVKKIEPKIHGYVWQGLQYEGLVAMFIEVLKGYGGYWINEKNKTVGLSNQDAIQAVKFLTEIQKYSPPGVTTYTERESSTDFQMEKAVFLRNWPYVWAQAQAKIPDKFDFVPMVGGNNKGYSCQGGWGLGIARNSQHQKEAWKAIQFFTSAATQRKYALRTGNMPSRLSLFNDPQLLKRYSYYPTLLKASKNVVLRPQIPEYAEVSKILQIHLSCILKYKDIKQKQIEQEMQKAANKTERLLQKYPKTDEKDNEKCALNSSS